MRFIDAFEVYYDNAEGCWQITSEINKAQKNIKRLFMIVMLIPKKRLEI